MRESKDQIDDTTSAREGNHKTCRDQESLCNSSGTSRTIQSEPVKFIFEPSQIRDLIHMQASEERAEK